MAADPEVRFTDEPDADAWIFDPRENVLLVSRPKAREFLGSPEASDSVMTMLAMAQWKESGRVGT
jgi:hypothetical protein